MKRFKTIETIAETACILCLQSVIVFVLTGFIFYGVSNSPNGWIASALKVFTIGIGVVAISSGLVYVIFEDIRLGMLERNQKPSVNEFDSGWIELEDDFEPKAGRWIQDQLEHDDEWMLLTPEEIDALTPCICRNCKFLNQDRETRPIFLCFMCDRPISDQECPHKECLISDSSLNLYPEG